MVSRQIKFRRYRSGRTEPAVVVHLVHFKTGTGTLAVAEFSGEHCLWREPVPALKPTLETSLSAPQVTLADFGPDGAAAVVAD